MDNAYIWYAILLYLLEEYGMLSVEETILFFRINIDVFKIRCERYTQTQY